MPDRNKKSACSERSAYLCVLLFYHERSEYQACRVGYSSFNNFYTRTKAVDGNRSLFVEKWPTLGTRYGILFWTSSLYPSIAPPALNLMSDSQHEGWNIPKVIYKQPLQIARILWDNWCWLLEPLSVGVSIFHSIIVYRSGRPQVFVPPIAWWDFLRCYSFTKCLV